MSLPDYIQKRFARQIRLSQIGESGQQKLREASVLVIGAGGLGCPALQYLAGAGIGKLTIMDFDKIELSNLHRQLLYDSNDIGRYKADVAAEKLRKIAPEAEVLAINTALDNKTAVQYFEDPDIIIDGTDQVHIRYLINDACRLYNKPWIYGAVNSFSGQWALFNQNLTAADYRDVFPNPPDPMTTANCEIAGTLGMVPGYIGVMQALETVKWICGFGTNEKTILHTADLLENTLYSVEVIHQKENEIRGLTEFLSTDYLNYVLGFHYKNEQA
jgi:molybdopterin/thiamine biosynthesis adenylyltransferase